jgi:[acyl-carrier-protein] S-malonyltransferase
MHFYKLGDYQMPYPMPTDEEVRAKLDLPTAKVLRPPVKSKPPLPVCFMFPGQGSQYPGMMKDAVSMPAVDAMLKEATKILGWDIKEMALKGTKEQMQETKVCQPLMFTAGMVAVEIMKSGALKETVERVQAVAGLSLGEYTAICTAGILDFPTCLKLVKLRGEAMQEATNLTPQCMCSVAGLERAVVDKTCKEAIAKNLEKDPVCQVANVLFPAGFSVSGTKKTIAAFCDLAKKARALQAKEIATGGAFHCPLMAPASVKLEAAIDAVKDKMQPPRCAIYFNVNAKKVPAGTDPAEFCELMKKQLVSEVLWENTMKQMIMDGVKDFYECGPMKQLQSMMKRIDQDAFKRTQLVSV